MRLESASLIVETLERFFDTYILEDDKGKVCRSLIYGKYKELCQEYGSEVYFLETFMYLLKKRFTHSFIRKTKILGIRKTKIFGITYQKIDHFDFNRPWSWIPKGYYLVHKSANEVVICRNLKHDQYDLDPGPIYDIVLQKDGTWKLEAFGIEVNFLLPSQCTEGYTMSASGVKEIADMVDRLKVFVLRPPECAESLKIVKTCSNTKVILQDEKLKLEQLNEEITQETGYKIDIILNAKDSFHVFIHVSDFERIWLLPFHKGIGTGWNLLVIMKDLCYETCVFFPIFESRDKGSLFLRKDLERLLVQNRNKKTSRNEENCSQKRKKSIDNETEKFKKMSVIRKKCKKSDEQLENITDESEHTSSANVVIENLETSSDDSLVTKIDPQMEQEFCSGNYITSVFENQTVSCKSSDTVSLMTIASVITGKFDAPCPFGKKMENGQPAGRKEELQIEKQFCSAIDTASLIENQNLHCIAFKKSETNQTCPGEKDSLTEEIKEESELKLAAENPLENLSLQREIFSGESQYFVVNNNNQSTDQSTNSLSPSDETSTTLKVSSTTSKMIGASDFLTSCSETTLKEPSLFLGEENGGDKSKVFVTGIYKRIPITTFPVPDGNAVDKIPVIESSVPFEDDSLVTDRLNTAVVTSDLSSSTNKILSPNSSSNISTELTNFNGCDQLTVPKTEPKENSSADDFLSQSALASKDQQGSTNISASCKVESEEKEMLDVSKSSDLLSQSQSSDIRSFPGLNLSETVISSSLQKCQCSMPVTASESDSFKTIENPADDVRLEEVCIPVIGLPEIKSNIFKAETFVSNTLKDTYSEVDHEMPNSGDILSNICSINSVYSLAHEGESCTGVSNEPLRNEESINDHTDKYGKNKYLNDEMILNDFSGMNNVSTCTPVEQNVDLCLNSRVSLRNLNANAGLKPVLDQSKHKIKSNTQFVKVVNTTDANIGVMIDGSCFSLNPFSSEKFIRYSSEADILLHEQSQLGIVTEDSNMQHEKSCSTLFNIPVKEKEAQPDSATESIRKVIESEKTFPACVPQQLQCLVQMYRSKDIKHFHELNSRLQRQIPYDFLKLKIPKKLYDDPCIYRPSFVVLRRIPSESKELVKNLDCTWSCRQRIIHTYKKIPLDIHFA